MPPRSAKRKKPSPAAARAKKLIPKSEQSDLEPSLVDQSTSELKNEAQELEAPADEEESDQASQPMTATEEIKQEVGVIDGGNAEVIVCTKPEAKVNEEVAEEGGNVENVMGDKVNVSTAESFLQRGGIAEEDGERMAGDQSETGHEKNDTAAKQNKGGHIDYDGGPLEHNSCEEGTAAAQITGAETLEDDVNVPILSEGDDREVRSEGSREDVEEIGNNEDINVVNNEDKEHPSVVIDTLSTDRKEEKDLEIFVSRLEGKTVEDDLIEVFGKFGEIKAVRIVRNPTTNKSRGFAFIQYATVEQAKSVLSALEGGIEVRGKHVKISASYDDNNTLYVGNICKLWTKERVLETLKSYGIESIEDMRLPDDPQKEGKTRGFAFLEFGTHSEAMAAYQRLRKPDAIFGLDKTAKVAFSRTAMHPSEEVLSQVKTVYMEGLTNAWNEVKVKEFCQQYGEVEEVRLSRNLGTRRKRKDFGFVSFAARESALACVDGINNVCIGEGDIKVKASIAKPLLKGRLQKQGPRGGFKVEKERGVPTMEEGSEREKEDVSSRAKVHTKSKSAKKKGKIVAEEKGKALFVQEFGGSGKSNRNQMVTDDHWAQASSKSERTDGKRTNLRMQVESHSKVDSKHGRAGKPSEKLQGNKRRNQSNNFGKRKRETCFMKNSHRTSDFVTYRNPYATGHDASVVSYEGHAYNTISGSKRPYADMEPHAGYVEPVARKQGRSHSGHAEPPVGMHYPPHAGIHYQPHEVYLQSAVGIYHQAHAVYQKPVIHSGYVDPALGTHAQPHAGYLEPAVGKSSHDLRGLTMRRAGRQEPHGIVPTVYVAGSSFPPSYAPNYRSYDGFEAGGSSVGQYQTSRAQLPSRTFY